MFRQGEAVTAEQEEEEKERQEKRGDVRRWLSHQGSVEMEVLQYPLHLLKQFFP